MRARASLAAAVAIALVASSTAAAGNVSWNESAKVKGAKVMTYTVDSFAFTTKGWHAHIAFRNVSAKTIKVGLGFGVAFYKDATTTSLTKGIGFVSPLTYSTKPPTSLKPGASWTGTIGGTGQVPVKTRIWARVVFGPFQGIPGLKATIVWITDHALPLAGGVSAKPPPGVVI